MADITPQSTINGIFPLYVPEEYATLGWGFVFVLALIIVAYWGSVDDQALEELQNRLDEIEYQEETSDDSHTT